MIGHPPRSTLFPTRRSSDLDGEIEDRRGGDDGLHGGLEAAVGRDRMNGDGVAGEARHQQERARPDRKSTRLNSSHMSISYAVFCLKKKKKTINETQLLYRN